MVSIGLHHQLFWLKVCDKMLFLSWCKTHYFFFFHGNQGICPNWIWELWGSTECNIFNEWSWISYANSHCWLGLQQWILSQWSDEKKEYKVSICTSFFFLKNIKRWWSIAYRKKSYGRTSNLRREVHWKLKWRNLFHFWGYMEKVEGHWKERKEMLNVFSFWYPNFTHSSRKKIVWA